MLARWLRRSPSVLLLDDPTQGVDVGARADLYHWIRQRAEQGMAAVLVSSDFEELAQVASRVLILRDGRIAGRLSGDEIDRQRITELGLHVREWGRMSANVDEAITVHPPEPAENRDDHGDRVRSNRTRALGLLERFGVLIILGSAIIVFSLLRPDTFATATNWRAIATSQSVLAVAAMALIVPLIGGRFDVSVGGVIGITSIATAAAMSRYDLPLVLAMFIGTGMGACIGFVNGFLVSRLGVNSIICTLGVATVLGGLVSWYTNGVPISSGLSTTLTDLSATRFAGVPLLFIVMIVICVLTWYLLTQTPFGRYLTAVGSNLPAARLTGVGVNRIVLLSFMISGTLAGVAGVLQIAALGNGNPQIGGLGFILPALAAVFLGATTWRPGRYNVPGTLLSLFFLGTMVSGLVLLGARPWITSVFNGTAVVVAIVLSAQFRRQRTGSMEIGD